MDIILGVHNLLADLVLQPPWGSFRQLGDTPGGMGAAGRTHEGPEPDTGKHSLECLWLQLESVSLSVGELWGDCDRRVSGL